MIRYNYRSKYFGQRVLLDNFECELQGRASNVLCKKEINIFMKNTEYFLECIDECYTKNNSEGRDQPYWKQQAPSNHRLLVPFVEIFPHGSLPFACLLKFFYVPIFCYCLFDQSIGKYRYSSIKNDKSIEYYLKHNL